MKKSLIVLVVYYLITAFCNWNLLPFACWDAQERFWWVFIGGIFAIIPVLIDDQDN